MLSRRRPALAAALGACLALSAQTKSSMDETLHLEHAFQAPPETVFDAWTDPAAIRQWFPDGAAVHWDGDPKVDARRGGRFDWRVVGDDNPRDIFHFRGAYCEITRPAKLAFTWNWSSLPIDRVHGPGKTLVTIEFAAANNGTKIVLTQTGLPSEAARDAHDKGWQRCFTGIAKIVERR